MKGVSTDNDDASREHVLILLKVMDLVIGNYFSTNQIMEKVPSLRVLKVCS